MPELPEVEIFRRRLDKTSLGLRIKRVVVLDAELLDGVTVGGLEEALAGEMLVETRRHGMRLMARVSSGVWLTYHFGLSGFLTYYTRSREPVHDRIRLDFDNGGHLAYVCQRKLGRVGLARSPGHLAADHDLGPDALDPDLTRERFAALFEKKRGALKSALMNQEILAGVGNVYSDEIMFQLGLHPKTSLEELGEQGLDRVYDAMRRVLEQAIEHGGEQGELPPSMITACRAGGLSCPKCGRSLDKIKISGRNSVFCPVCQPGAEPSATAHRR